jgi:hypothetical protein
MIAASILVLFAGFAQTFETEGVRAGGGWPARHAPERASA